MKVVDLKNDGKGLRFSVAGRMATAILERGKQAAEEDLEKEGFTAEQINRHRDAAHFLIAIDKLSLRNRMRLWLGRILRRLSN
jgi:hypothetical protein